MPNNDYPGLGMNGSNDCRRRQRIGFGDLSSQSPLSCPCNATRAVAATRRDIPEVIGGVTFDCAVSNMSPPRSNNANDTNGVMGEDAQPTTIDWHQQLAGAG